MTFDDRKQYEWEMVEELSDSLWKQVHPIRRWFTKPPEYRPWTKSRRNPNKTV